MERTKPRNRKALVGNAARLDIQNPNLFGILHLAEAQRKGRSRVAHPGVASCHLRAVKMPKRYISKSCGKCIRTHRPESADVNFPLRIGRYRSCDREMACRYRWTILCDRIQTCCRLLVAGPNALHELTLDFRGTLARLASAKIAVA